jgi:hypothetical protein
MKNQLWETGLVFFVKHLIQLVAFNLTYTH